MSTTERLKKWVDTLSEEQLKSIVVSTVDFCIDSEEVSFYETSKVPYWSNSGKSLDGSEEEEI
jgi:hypothetical protein